jgi:hypothetical protein
VSAPRTAPPPAPGIARGGGAATVRRWCLPIRPVGIVPGRGGCRAHPRLVFPRGCRVRCRHRTAGIRGPASRSHLGDPCRWRLPTPVTEDRAPRAPRDPGGDLRADGDLRAPRADGILAGVVDGPSCQGREPRLFPRVTTAPPCAPRARIGAQEAGGVRIRAFRCLDSKNPAACEGARGGVGILGVSGRLDRGWRGRPG